MRLGDCLRDGTIQKIDPDFIRAKSLCKSAIEAITAAQKIPFEQSTLKSIMRELYEGLRQYCEAIGYQQGYKWHSHEYLTLFLEQKLNEPILANRFDRYRKLRNGINYYGDEISPQTVKEALQEIPLLIKKLKSYLKS